MKRKIAIVLFVLVLVYLASQLAGGKYGTLWIPILWLFVIVAPMLKSTERSDQNLLVIYYLVALVTLLSQAIFLATRNIGCEQQLLWSFAWVLPLLALFWFKTPEVSPNSDSKASLVTVKLTDSLNSIRALIAKNEIELALEKATQTDQLTENQKNEVLNMSFRYQEAKRKNRLGVLSNEELSLEKNRIVTGLIELTSILYS